ncbi:MAG: hypothetical protein KBD23_00260 [Gammaproteobacteria bacterium]|nr:hypothetical protein [Gammaproteobacteria bacterium]MBP9728564.1 hypothetical protein [Gammaproteobacteria bacterium]
MSLNSFLAYVVPLQAFVAVGTGTWQILRPPKQSRQVQHAMITSAFDYSMNTLSNAAAIGTGLEAVTGDHP